MKFANLREFCFNSRTQHENSVNRLWLKRYPQGYVKNRSLDGSLDGRTASFKLILFHLFAVWTIKKMHFLMKCVKFVRMNWNGGNLYIYFHQENHYPQVQKLYLDCINLLFKCSDFWNCGLPSNIRLSNSWFIIWNGTGFNSFSLEWS